MKNLARFYSVENQGVEPWIWTECEIAEREIKYAVNLTRCEYFRGVKLDQLLDEYLFVAEDANWPGDFKAGNDLSEVQSYCDRMNEEGAAFFIYPRSRGFAR